MNYAGIIFDGDDTLWHTMPFYTQTKERFFDEMSTLGFNREEVKLTFERDDAKNVQRFGFSKRRFPTSMAETYRLFCTKYGVPLSHSVEEQIRELGYSVFGNSPLIREDVEDVLNRLSRHYRLVLATKGDPDVQQTKIEQTGLGHFFSSIYILGNKTTQELQRIAKECQLAVFDSWVIGDSLKSDINPGLEVGFRAIWIRTTTWTYEEDAEPNCDRLFKVDAIPEILELLIPEEANVLSV
jgi:putative hydrolase of the HAD superfamily